MKECAYHLIGPFSKCFASTQSSFHVKACCPWLSLVFAIQFLNYCVITQSNDPKWNTNIWGNNIMGTQYLGIHDVWHKIEIEFFGGNLDGAILHVFEHVLQFLFLLVAIWYVEKPIIYWWHHPCNHWDWYQGNYICIDGSLLLTWWLAFRHTIPCPHRNSVYREYHHRWLLNFRKEFSFTWIHVIWGLFGGPN